VQSFSVAEQAASLTPKENRLIIGFEPQPRSIKQRESATSWNCATAWIAEEFMRTNVNGTGSRVQAGRPGKTVFPILAAISFCHLLNDMMQSVIPAIYPLLKNAYHLDFGQVGLITLSSQLTASLLQPVVGSYTDRRPQPYSLTIGMCFTFVGLLVLSVAPSFAMILVAAAMVGMGSAVFHPESSRVARMASGGQHGLAQSLFQVGGNAGSALGPLLAAFIVLRRGQSSISWFSLAALLAMIVLANVGAWYRKIGPIQGNARTANTERPAVLSTARIATAIAILLALIFSKYFYLASLTSYYTFYLIGRFHISVQNAQIHLFVFLGAVAAGTIIGGPIGDRIGRKYVIWCSILGVLPFTLLLPYANLFWTGVLSVFIGLILASAFSAILVYAQDLVPGKVGMISGLFFGFAFGMGGVGAALLGKLADLKDINFVYRVCSFLPLIGLLAGWLPSTESISFGSRRANDENTKRQGSTPTGPRTQEEGTNRG
jgi:MFS transporter, FSR family, fosmidomycin resistance protein